MSDSASEPAIADATGAYRPRKPRRSETLELRGVPYHVNLWGERDAPLLVLLHGWGDAGATFQFLVDELERDWFVVAPDWRGFGRTHYRTSSYWFPDYLADLDRLLAHYSPGAPARVLGHSMGANVAALYAGAMFERIARFVNVEGFGLRDSDPQDAPARYRRWLEAEREGARYSRYDELGELARRIQRRAPTLSDGRALFVAAQWAERDEDGRISLRADPAHKLVNPVLYRRAEAEACWRSVTAPVLFVIGGDTDFETADMRRVDPHNALDGFPDLTTVEIEGAGHMVHFEQPAALARAVEAFMAG